MATCSAKDGTTTLTVWLIDWAQPQANHFAFAEEVTVNAANAKASGKRPDIVLYVNGIALGVLELKRSTVSVAEGIRQNLDNQKKDFIEPFFSTLQWVMVGNDTEGLRYGTIQTPEKYYLKWGEDSGDFAAEPNLLDRQVLQVCQPARLRVHEQDGPARVAIRGLRMIDLFVRPGTTTAQREAVLLNWYRAQLKALIPPLLQKWQPLLGVKVRDWGVKKMKTKWGTCSIEPRRIWINLELAKKPMRCLEYIVVHEMVHLLERNHGDRFTALMDRYLPDWASRRAELQKTVLGAEDWTY